MQLDYFRFRINVSRDYYEKKDDALACLSRAGARAVGKEKMAFSEQNVTVSEFMGYALTGHTFCNLFAFDPDKQYWIEASNGQHYETYPVYKKGANKGYMKVSFKSDAYFSGSQTIFIDVDETRFEDVANYLNTLYYPPTCVYMSYSDNKLKGETVSRRFRLVYVMDHVLNKDEFLWVSRAINDRIVMDTAEPMKDTCGERMSQYMNGVYNNSESYTSNVIYSVDDFPAPIYDNVPDEDISSVNITESVVFNTGMVSDMTLLDYDRFMHYYSTQYRYVYRSEKPEWPYLTYQLTDESYLQLWFYTEKQKDTEKRRKKLFKNACLRRLMYPDIDADTLLFNLYVDRERFFDNSDGILTIDTLMRNVRNAMKMTLEQLKKQCEWEIDYWRRFRPIYIYRPGVKATRGLNSYTLKTILWRNINICYDRTMSVQENARILDVSPSTLYRFCNEYEINTNPRRGTTEAQKRMAKKMTRQEKIDIFKKTYDNNLSIRDNRKILSLLGIELSVGTVHNWIEKYL